MIRLPPPGVMAIVVATASLLAGCASAPTTRLHSLLPDPASQTSLPAPAAAVVVVVGQLLPVRVPLAVDQPQWLVRLPDQSLRVLEQERWTSPLRDELQASLREHLAQRWGLQDGVAPGWRITLELQRFESMPGQVAWIAGRYSLANSRGAIALACSFSMTRNVDQGALALAQGHRQLLRALADQIGPALQALAASQPAACPPAP